MSDKEKGKDSTQNLMVGKLVHASETVASDHGVTFVCDNNLSPTILCLLRYGSEKARVSYHQNLFKFSIK